MLVAPMGRPAPRSGSQSFMPERIGRYRIIGELGQGGMGAIYLGRADGLGGFERLVAIKTIHRHLSGERQFIDMFLDEARIAASIRHPHVVSVFDVGEEDGRYYIAMDYVSGDPFSVLLDRTWGRHIAVPAHAMAYVVAVACEGLHAAHELKDPTTGASLGVVHRDICPQNILVGYDGIVRLMDFGVAKAAGQLALTNPGVHKGKVPYMSPEQVKGHEIDRRSDVFAMGVVLWEATVGRRLFKDENDLRSAARVLRGRVPPPSTIVDGYPTALEKVVLRALDPDPESRFQTARELGDGLQGCLAPYGRFSSVDVANLMQEHCPDRVERKKEIERHASVAALDEVVLDRKTRELFIGDEQLPSHDLDEDVGEEDLQEVSAVLLGLAGVPDSATPDAATERLDLRSPGFVVLRGTEDAQELTRPLGDRVPEQAFFEEGSNASAPTLKIDAVDDDVASLRPKLALPLLVLAVCAAGIAAVMFLQGSEPAAPFVPPAARHERAVAPKKATPADDVTMAPKPAPETTATTEEVATEETTEEVTPEVAPAAAPEPKKAEPKQRTRRRRRRTPPKPTKTEETPKAPSRFLVGPEDL